MKRNWNICNLCSMVHKDTITGNVHCESINEAMFYDKYVLETLDIPVECVMRLEYFLLINKDFKTETW